MQVIVGLGNPGTSYEKTRHNVGWMVLDKLAALTNAPRFQFEKKFQAQLSRTPSRLLIKPQTFMNESGVAVRQALKFYTDFDTRRVPELRQLFVIHDDLDLELGSYKVHFGRGPKIHNGLSSLYQMLGTEQFWHVRVGVDSRGGDRSIPGREYVLKPFSPEEKNTLDQVIPEIIAAVLARLDTIQ